MFIEVETPGVSLAKITPPQGWAVAYHRLFDVEPDQASGVRVIGANISIWHLCFSEDLLQVVNQTKSLLVDVGWYPAADKNGLYKLQVIRIERKIDGNSSYDWANPVKQIKTKSLSRLLLELEAILQN